jgi:MFS family permease
MLCALPMLVGPLLSAAANGLNMMVAGRFLAGVAIGLSSALVPLYISEVRARLRVRAPRRRVPRPSDTHTHTHTHTHTWPPQHAPQVAPTSIRGTLGSLNQLMICLGILAALLVNVALPVAQWRTMFMLAAAPAALLFVGACAAGRAARVRLCAVCAALRAPL